MTAPAFDRFVGCMTLVQEPRPSDGIAWPSPSLFDALDDAARAALAPHLDVFSVNGGRVVFSRGEPSDALYVVLSGVLGVVIEDAAGRPTLHGHVATGETVGEMGVLSGRPRSATVIALRDSRLLRMRRETFVDLVSRHPRAMMRVTAQLVGRLEAATAAPAANLTPTSLAIMPLGDAFAAPRLGQALAQALAGALAAMGLRTATLDASAAHWTAEAFALIEAAQDLTIYVGLPDETVAARPLATRAHCGTSSACGKPTGSSTSAAASRRRRCSHRWPRRPSCPGG